MTLKNILPLTLQSRLLLALCATALIQAILLGGYALQHLASSLEEQIGQRALQMAKGVATQPEVRIGVQQRNSRNLQKLAERIRLNSDARFVVIGTIDGIRLSHPVPERIGKAMKGGDNYRALKLGESYVSKAVGTLGPSIRGKTPILDERGEIIGLVSVGYMLDNVSMTIYRYQASIIVAIFVGLIFSVLAALRITSYFKKAIFGLEPEQIARLFQEYDATLESVREGIIAVNTEGTIITFNPEAVRLFGLTEGESLKGKHLSDILPDSTMLSLLETREPQFDREIYRNNNVLVANRIPIFDGDTPVGVVSSFRLKDELDMVSQRLTQSEQYAQTLRSQTHEYANKLNTIAGLIELGANKQALELISSETQAQQALIHLLVNAVEDPVLSGCIIGKFNRAREMGLNLILDDESTVGALPKHIKPEQIITVLGNLLDNAYEASLKTQATSIYLSMTDIGKDIIIEVEDRGPGISTEVEQQIFTQGYSSKDEGGHGWGLYLAKQIVTLLEGSIQISKPNEGGTRITLFLPKELKNKSHTPTAYREVRD
ncbi:MAG: two-component sensor histidine kinase [Osedax symbiont Rs1]|nr:MAG: two-component sensor histidine kinase [Osedax symbiont Rs1]